MSRISIVAVLGCAMWAGGLAAEEVILPLNDDTFINGNEPGIAFGDTTEPLYVHTWGPKETLLQFDAAAIAGQDVVAAELAIPLSSLQAAGSIDLYALTTGWNESTATYDNSPSAESVAAASTTVDTSATAVSFDVTGVVRRWADGTLPAAGVLLVTSDPMRAVLDSKETGSGATLQVETQGSAGVRRTTLDLSSAPVEIDQPGIYELDRDWSMGTQIGQIGTLVTVSADDVTLDFRGYEITFQHNGTGIRVDGEDFTVRNGRLAGDLDSYAIYSETAAGTTIDGMDIYSYEGLVLTGHGAAVTDSTIRGRFGASIGSRATLEKSSFSCTANCMSLTGGETQVRGNRIVAAQLRALSVRSAGNVVADNVFGNRTADDSLLVIDVEGDDNQVLRNTVLLYGDESVIVDVQGTRNTIVGNVAAPSVVSGVGPPTYGIRFAADGNWYGDNRISAAVPFELGGTVQTDWGGNVSY